MQSENGVNRVYRFRFVHETIHRAGVEHAIDLTEN